MRFGILGPLLVDDGSRLLPVRAALQRALLATLLLRANTVVSADELVEALWGEQPPRNARGALHNHVMRLRQALGADPGSRLRTQPPGYVLDVHDNELDLQRFNSLCERGRTRAKTNDWQEASANMGAALSLWRGQPLMDVPCESLQRNKGPWLDELRVQALEWRIDADLHLGKYEELISELRQLVRSHPLRERFHAQLMLALFHSNRQAEALTVYHDVRKTLIDGLGVEPGADLRQVHKQILTTDPGGTADPPVTYAAPAPRPAPTAAPAPAPQTPRPARPQQVGPPPLSGSGLFDRDGELATLANLAAGVQAGYTWLVLVRGALGIGKTALLDEWAGRERTNGMRVLRATCSDAESALPFAVVRQLFEPVLAAAGAVERVTILGGQATHACQALSVDATPPADQPVSYAMLHGLYWLLVNLTNTVGPIVIIIDDLHWADTASVRWLSYASRRLDGLPVLLVLSAQDYCGETSPVNELYSELSARRDCCTITPGPMTDAGIGQMIHDILGAAPEPQFSAACRHLTGGNAFCLRELLAILAAHQVPPLAANIGQVHALGVQAVARWALEVLAGQPEATVRVATALAVLGDDPPGRVTAELACLLEFDVTRQIRRLKYLGVLCDTPTVRFRYPTIRTTIADTLLTPVQRTLAHATAARLLYYEGARSEVVAGHLVLTDFVNEEWCVETLLDAARSARDRDAPELTMEYLKRAMRESLSTPDRIRVLSALGDDELRRYPPTATRYLRESMALITDPDQRVKAARSLAASLMLSHRRTEAIAMLAEVAPRLTPTNGTTVQANRAFEHKP